MARPTKYNAEREKKIIDALRTGCSRRDAYEYGGIDAQTFATWLKRYSDFSVLVQEAESQAAVMHTANITKAAKDGDWKASLEWLKRRRRDEWGDSIAFRADREVEAALAALFPGEAGTGAGTDGAAVSTE